MQLSSLSSKQNTSLKPNAVLGSEIKAQNVHSRPRVLKFCFVLDCYLRVLVGQDGQEVFPTYVLDEQQCNYHECGFYQGILSPLLGCWDFGLFFRSWREEVPLQQLLPDGCLQCTAADLCSLSQFICGHDRLLLSSSSKNELMSRGKINTVFSFLFLHEVQFLPLNKN